MFWGSSKFLYSFVISFFRIWISISECSVYVVQIKRVVKYEILVV